MKLLFDQNLSHRLILINALSDLFPGSVHVRNVGLQAASDGEVWSYARHNALVIVSKDSGFHQRSFLYGHPPKVIWIRRGNCSTRDIEILLRERSSDLIAFEQDEQGAFLALT